MPALLSVFCDLSAELQSGGLSYWFTVFLRGIFSASTINICTLVTFGLYLSARRGLSSNLEFVPSRPMFQSSWDIDNWLKFESACQQVPLANVAFTSVLFGYRDTFMNFVARRLMFQ